ncbi:hypothetical protein FRC03_002579 [Tulasnella sp. 419]|nr:hypothetical protein FRC03_002579 [Tulasnella sp. 419]
MTHVSVNKIVQNIAPQELGIQNYNVEHLNLTGRVELLKIVDQGGFSDIWHGKLRDKDGSTSEVAIKQLRGRPGEARNIPYKILHRRFCQEVVLWSKLQHPNIVPLLGYMVTRDNITAFPGLISPWYQKGDVVSYLKMNPQANRKQLLLDVASALQYLHEIPLVHGDVKGGNVLVDMEDHACLCDFGMSTFCNKMEDPTTLVTDIHLRGTPRFTAPELLNSPTTTPNTTMSDIWSFGCLAIQIMLDVLPYQHKKTMITVYKANLAGESPLLVHDMIRNPAEELFWHKMQPCWSVYATYRPTAQTLVIEITNFINTSAVVDLDITDGVVLGDAIAQAQYWGIYQGRHKTGTSSTAIMVKVFHAYDCRVTPAIQKVRKYTLYEPCLTFAHKQLCEKISHWSSMRHMNLVPIIGYVVELSHLALPSLVLPSYRHCNMDVLLFDASDSKKYQFLLDVARGLNYLHHFGTAHGDIRPSNIYVDAKGCASLAGYWTSSYLEITAAAPDSALNQFGQDIRYMAPEILQRQPNSTAADMWAIGCLAIKIVINHTPYEEMKDAIRIADAITQGQQPISVQDKLSDLPHIHLWACIRQCWDQDPNQRPHSQQLVSALLDLETLPNIESLDLSKDLQVGNKTFEGVNSDLYMGVLRSKNTNVAVKLLRVANHSWKSKMTREERLQKESPTEILTWNNLAHPHVVPLLGFAMVKDTCPALISPWIENGSVSKYLEYNSSADRVLLLLDIIRGLDFLHGKSLMHGDLKADNVLVDIHGKASLADFGISKFMDEMHQVNGFSTEGGFGGNLRFASPESVMEDEKFLATDVWAFACTAIQIMKNQPPYHRIKDDGTVLTRIIAGEPPWNSEDSIFSPSDLQLWNELQSCWTLEPAARPDASRLLRCFRERFYNLCRSTTGFLEPESELKNLTGRVLAISRVASGAISDVSRGYLKPGKKPIYLRLTNNFKVEEVAIKEIVLRQPGGDSERLGKLLLREATIWSRLKHPNIVPFLGYAIEGGSRYCFVAPWYANGDVVRYLQSHPDVNRLLLALDVAQGLCYLHEVGVIHGDVKGANILINGDGRASLCGMGTTHIMEFEEEHSFVFERMGTLRWMASERLVEDSPSTVLSDVWSFGCVTIEVMLSKRPYSHLPLKSKVISALVRGTPPLPHDYFAGPYRFGTEHEQYFWEQIYRCWNPDPFRRPLMRDIVAMIKQQLSPS